MSNDLAYQMTVPGRECGDCTLCCKVTAIEHLAKPASSWCPHCKPGRGCRIYPERPDECRSFNCLWLVNDHLDERWRPSKSKLVLTTSEDGIEVRCDLDSPMPGAGSLLAARSGNGLCPAKRMT